MERCGGGRGQKRPVKGMGGLGKEAEGKDRGRNERKEGKKKRRGKNKRK